MCFFLLPQWRGKSLSWQCCINAPDLSHAMQLNILLKLKLYSSTRRWGYDPHEAISSSEAWQGRWGCSILFQSRGLVASAYAVEMKQKEGFLNHISYGYHFFLLGIRPFIMNRVDVALHSVLNPSNWHIYFLSTPNLEVSCKMASFHIKKCIWGRKRYHVSSCLNVTSPITFRLDLSFILHLIVGAAGWALV